MRLPGQERSWPVLDWPPYYGQLDRSLGLFYGGTAGQVLLEEHSPLMV